MIGLLQDESGSSAVEYGLLMSLIFLVIIAAVMAFGNIVSIKLFGVAVSQFPH
jgi:Flp pilus assembly pilin Flp